MGIQVDDPIEITVDRARKMWYIIWAGVIWSFIYTAVSVVLLYHMSGEINEFCAARQEDRAAIRVALALDPDWSVDDQVLLNESLPSRLDC